jgi:hypothetical protein
MRSKPIQLLLILTLALWALSSHAWASTAGAGLPMEGPLDKLKQSFSGPIAWDIGLCAAVGGFALVCFAGHQFIEFFRSGTNIALCLGAITGVTALAAGLGINGAEVTKGLAVQAKHELTQSYHPPLRN